MPWWRLCRITRRVGGERGWGKGRRSYKEPEKRENQTSEPVEKPDGRERATKGEEPGWKVVRLRRERDPGSASAPTTLVEEVVKAKAAAGPSSGLAVREPSCSRWFRRAFTHSSDALRPFQLP